MTDSEKQENEHPLRSAYIAALKLPKYTRSIGGKSHADPVSNYVTIYRDILGELSAELRILAPQQINEFLQVTKEFSENKRYAVRTGLFISALIAHNYNGNHCFVLNTQGLPLIDYLEASGSEESPLELVVQGSVGNNCFRQIKHAKVTVDGNAGSYCGSYCENSEINVKGDVGEYCGYSSRNSIFNIGGFAGKNCGDASSQCSFVAKKFDTDWNLDLSHPRHGCGDSEFVIASRRSFAKLGRLMKGYQPEMPSEYIDQTFKAKLTLTNDSGQVLDEKDIQS